MSKLCVLLLVMSCGLQAANEVVVDILKSENFTSRYNEILNGRSALAVEEFTPLSAGSHLEIVEMILLQQALYLGGETRPVKFKGTESHNLNEYTDLISGDVLTLGRTLWFEDTIDFLGSLYVSEAVIPYGQYEAGFYVAKDNLAAQSMTIADLHKLKVVANPRWKADWRALKNTPVIINNFIGPWENMLAMVDAKIVDAMLVNFSVSPDLILRFAGKEFVPIPNLKVMLPDSRHFVVSKQHPEGKLIFEALEKGLVELNEQDKIARFYQQAGFINPQVKEWQLVNQAMVVVDD